MSLLSKSGKVLYLCGTCRSSKISPMRMRGRKCYACTPCMKWYEWPTRIKLSVRRLEATVPGATRTEADETVAW